VDAILAKDSHKLTAPDMVSRATWADKWREHGHRETADWHFVDQELVRPNLKTACFSYPTPSHSPSPGPAQDCIVDKIASGPIQLAATVEITGVVDTHRERYVRFVVSGPPRGGLSGGPVFHLCGFVLGMVIESLEYLGTTEPGFLTVLSIESFHELLEQHGLTPSGQMPPTAQEIIEIARKKMEARQDAGAAMPTINNGGADDARQ
jgi:hypothetical protein